VSYANSTWGVGEGDETEGVLTGDELTLDFDGVGNDVVDAGLVELDAKKVTEDVGEGPVQALIVEDELVGEDEACRARLGGGESGMRGSLEERDWITWLDWSFWFRL
jgi:hypothetical protein